MTEIVSGVLKLTFGFLANKARSKIAEHLKDGDVTDEECRRLIVTQLEDIKTQLKGLARKDLLASLCFLQEGVNGLYQSLLQFKSKENTAELPEQATLVEAASSRGTGPDSPINEAIILANAIASLEIHSGKRFKSAIKSIALAREKATEAFCNEALPIEDRIQASQVRMMARILEKLEDPDAGVSDCLQYMKQLHDIGAIREIFSVLIDGGLKSRFNKTKRLNNASSVRLMNQLLLDFARKFTTASLLACIFAWPTIPLGKISYHPILEVDRLKTGVDPISRYQDYKFTDEIMPSYSVVNSKREIVAKTAGDLAIKVFKHSGERRTLCKVPKEEHECYFLALKIDAKDNLYVITGYKKESDARQYSFKLFIFDENGNKKLESSLPFHQDWEFVPMTINKDGKIAVLDCCKNILHIGDRDMWCNSFKVHHEHVVYIRFSDYFSETKIIAAGDDTVDIYTEDGKLERIITIPEGHGCIRSVAINHITKGILVTTGKYEPPYNLLSFSETGELTDSLCLGSSEWLRYAQLTSHPNGAVALVDETRAVLLQE